MSLKRIRTIIRVILVGAFLLIVGCAETIESELEVSLSASSTDEALVSSLLGQSRESSSLIVPSSNESSYSFANASSTGQLSVDDSFTSQTAESSKEGTLSSSLVEISSSSQEPAIHLNNPGKYLLFPEPEILTVAVPEPSQVDFNSVMGGYTFPTSFTADEINRLNEWSRIVVAQNPFEGLARNEVPWISIYASAATHEQSYAFISHEQLAYLFLITLFGGDIVHPTKGNMITGLEYSANYTHETNYWMFSVMTLLTSIMDNEHYRTTYVGAAMGNMNQTEGFDAIVEKGMAERTLAELNACYFDEGKILITSDADPLKPEWCRGESNKPHPIYGVILDSEGASFQAKDIPGQTTVDIGGLHYGGGTECAGCHVANTQDECLAVFYPETIAFSFFMEEGSSNPGLIHITDALTFFGVRKYLHGLNGSNRFNAGLCAYPQGPATEMLEEIVNVDVQGEKITLYDHSMTFVASLNNISGPENWWSAEKKVCGVPGGACNNKEYDFCALADVACPGGSSSYTPPIIDIGKWYGAFAPEAYHTDLNQTMKKMIRRIGTFNWGAGVWWGDAEAYFLYVWLGTSMLENVTLDYYLYASSCENSGVQCGMLSGDDCTGCYARTAWDANPFQESCSNKGINGVYDAVKTKSAQELYEQLLGVLNSEGHLFDQF